MEIPGAEPVVATHRLRLDPAAALGVPAHVTVLFPFVPPHEITHEVVKRARLLFAGCDPFGYRFGSTDWFADSVLWLAPDDPEPFRELTSCACGAFPAYQPYAGEHVDVVPHLTVGQDRGLDELRAAEVAVSDLLPVTGRAVSVTLMTQVRRNGRWTRKASFALGG